MSALIPYRNLRTRPETMLFDDFFRPFFYGGGVPAFKVDVKDEGNHYLLSADLPGVSREDIALSVEDGTLTISATWNSEKSEDAKGYIMNERRTGSAKRSFALENVNEESISAEYKDGVLRLTLPKITEEKAPRRIEIQ